tara:strand:- start:1998 stop:3284 length:1287 start_codon:yes stop_codon:yes gene_type:complete
LNRHTVGGSVYFIYSIAMTKSDLAKVKLPDSPGVYFFLGTNKKILYIGKATSLRSRVRSYFGSDLEEKRSLLIEKMVSEAKTVEFTPTDSTLEALILETNMIRTHKPTYNTRSKDDKSYNHLVITNEEFPRVLVVRGKDVTEKFAEQDIKYEFGPFPSGVLFREALKIVRKLFKFYDTKKPVGEQKSRLERGKIDFNKQIGLFPSEENQQEYKRTINHIKLFFEGKKQQIIKELEKEMMLLAKKEKFEEANHIKKRIFALQHIQDISLISDDRRHYRDDKSLRIEAFDVAHLQGDSMVGVMTVVDGVEPQKSEYRKFKVNGYTSSNDVGALKEILERRFKHKEWRFPDVLVVDGSTAQKNAAQAILRQNSLVIPVVAVVKDDKHKPIRLVGQKDLLNKHKDSVLLANAESHRFAISYHRSLQRKKQFK